MSETRKYRRFSSEQKIEIVLAGLRGDRPVRDVCGKYEISEALFYQWRERLLEGWQDRAGCRRVRGTRSRPRPRSWLS